MFRTWFGSASSACSASVRAVRIWVNWGRGRAAGTMARASGRAATMRLENMLEGCEFLCTYHRRVSSYVAASMRGCWVLQCWMSSFAMSSGVTPAPRPWRRSGPVCFETTTFDVTRRRLRDGSPLRLPEGICRDCRSTVQTSSHYRHLHNRVKGLVLRARAR
jgi:hypothetical protein